MNEIVQIISTVGFPIACCLGMAWFFKYITDKERDERNNLNEHHKEEMNKIVDALNNNTLAIQKLCDRLDLER